MFPPFFISAFNIVLSALTIIAPMVLEVTLSESLTINPNVLQNPLLLICKLAKDALPVS